MSISTKSTEQCALQVGTLDVGEGQIDTCCCATVQHVEQSVEALINVSVDQMTANTGYQTATTAWGCYSPEY